ncbi:MAG: hypothetical protein FJZ86_18320 [Chloroflexi bacterium]|nr:hypothetical protein [Chloroflexota bacterium]
MSKYSVSQDVQSQLQGTLRDNSAVRLPFGAPQLWWANGKPPLFDVDEIKDARRFGGFGISKEDVDNQKEQLPPELPYHWTLFPDLTNSKGKKYAAFLTRTAWVAPIIRRYRWSQFDGKSRSQVEYLCYLAVMERETRKLNPWGAVVISGSSYSGGAIDDAIKTFGKMTADLRGGTPQNFFFHPLGTWGNDPKPEDRTGKGGQTSVITPCQLFTPEKGYTEETLDKWFVPQEYHAELAELLARSKDWVADWTRKPDHQEAPVQVDEEYT